MGDTIALKSASKANQEKNKLGLAEEDEEYRMPQKMSLLGQENIMWISGESIDNFSKESSSSRTGAPSRIAFSYIA